MIHFKSCDNKGFHIIFENGVTISTQFGPGSYGDNHDEPFDFENPKRSWDASEVEIAIWKDNGKTWITKEFSDEGDSVLGYVPFDKWLRAFDWCRNYVEPVTKGTE